MSKRKRDRFIYYDDEPPSKKLKLLSVEDQKIFSEGLTYQTFDVNNSEFEQQKFEEVLNDENPRILFSGGKMKTTEEQDQFYRYIGKNHNEFNGFVRQPPPLQFSGSRKPSASKSKSPSFSAASWKKKKTKLLIRDYFQKKPGHWDILDNFVAGQDFKVVELSKIVFNRFQGTRSTYEYDHERGNEESRKKYIDCFVDTVLPDFKQEGPKEREAVVVGVDDELEGEFSHGRVEYVFKYGDLGGILLIVEANGERGLPRSAGLNQLIMELITSYQNNGDIELDYVYGFVTDASWWKPVRVKYSEREKSIDFGNSCVVPVAYTEEQLMKQLMERVIFVMREMLKRGVEDYKSKT